MMKQAQQSTNKVGRAVPCAPNGRNDARRARDCAPYLVAAFAVAAFSAQAQMKFTPKPEGYEFEGSAGGTQRLQYPTLTPGTESLCG